MEEQGKWLLERGRLLADVECRSVQRLRLFCRKCRVKQKNVMVRPIVFFVCCVFIVSDMLQIL